MQRKYLKKKLVINIMEQKEKGEDVERVRWRGHVKKDMMEFSNQRYYGMKRSEDMKWEARLR